MHQCLQEYYLNFSKFLQLSPQQNNARLNAAEHDVSGELGDHDSELAQDGMVASSKPHGMIITTQLLRRFRVFVLSLI